MSNQQQDKRTASQRIDDMERGLMALYQTVDSMARDLMTIKEAIKLLGNKLDSVVKQARTCPNLSDALTDEKIAGQMVANNLEELKEKVAGYVANGAISPTETADANSFVVGAELNEDGTVANPRLQFVVQALSPAAKEKMIGAKAGDKVTVETWNFLVQEIYKFNDPTPPQAPQAEGEPAQAES